MESNYQQSNEKANVNAESDLNLMTILIGLEIDSAKNGFKPYIPNHLIIKEKEPFLQLKENLKKREYGDDEQNQEKTSKAFGKLNNLDDKIKAKLNALPKNKKQVGENLKNLINIDIDALKNNVSAYAEKKLKMQALLCAHYSLKYDKEEPDVVFDGSIYGKLLHRILSKQGNYVEYIDEVEKKCDEIYRNISMGDIEQLLAKLRTEHWAFTEAKNRKEKLSKLIKELEPETVEIIDEIINGIFAKEDGNFADMTLFDIFCNFNFNGYNSIILFFKHIKYLQYGSMDKEEKLYEWLLKNIKKTVRQLEYARQLKYNENEISTATQSFKNLLKKLERNELDDLNKYYRTAGENDEENDEDESQPQDMRIIEKYLREPDSTLRVILESNSYSEFNERIIMSGVRYETVRRKEENITKKMKELLGETGQAYKSEYEEKFKKMESKLIKDINQKFKEIALEICEEDETAVVGLCVDICGEKGEQDFNENNKIFWICAADIAIKKEMIKRIDYQYPNLNTDGNYEYLYQKYTTQTINDFE